MTAESAARSTTNLGDPLSRTELAAKFREAAALCGERAAGLQNCAVEVNLRIHPALAGDLRLVQQTFNRIAEMIAAGDVDAATLAVIA